MTKGFNHDNLEAVVNKFVKISKLFLVLALLPASASAVSFTNLEITNTSFSVNISGNLPNETPSSSKDFIFVVNANELADPGFVTGELLTSITSGFPGSQGVAHLYTGSVYDYLYIDFYGNIPALPDLPGLNVGDPLIGTVSGNWSSTAFDPSAVTSVNFYWGTGPSGLPNSGISLGSASIPDSGSTAALLGVGVVALAFARRRLG